MMPLTALADVDPALASWCAGAAEICPDAELVEVLRHVPGRRVTALIATSWGSAVVKVFSSPRARGNARRWQSLARTNAASAVAAVLATDRSGHVNVLEHIQGHALADLRGDETSAAAFAAGQQLRRIHDSGASFDRTWTVDDERAQLLRFAGARSLTVISQMQATSDDPCSEPLVPSHRDCHPGQAILGSDGAVRWIDLDDAAMAPASLDVGNLLAHLTRQEVLGRWNREETGAARVALIDGYGFRPPAVDAWERLALARLLALADTRHDSAEETDMMRELVLAACHRSQRGGPEGCSPQGHRC